MTHNSRRGAHGCHRPPAPPGGHDGRLRSAAIVPILVGLAAGLGPAEPASAQDRRGFRFGIAVPLERTGVTYEKAVDKHRSGHPGAGAPAR